MTRLVPAHGEEGALEGRSLFRSQASEGVEHAVLKRGRRPEDRDLPGLDASGGLLGHPDRIADRTGLGASVVERSKVPPSRWRLVAATAARQRPLAMAAVPMENQGRITWSII